jgi:membrane peptidoglycan carboxypeptidase
MTGPRRTVNGVLGGVLGLLGLSAIAGVLIAATVTPAVAVTGQAASSALTLFDRLPSYLEVDRPMAPTTIYAIDENGEDFELTSFYDQNRDPVGYDEIAPVMVDALLSSEDPRYYEHGGVDIQGTTRALLSNVAGAGGLQGGSTISQQYVKNVLIQRCEQEAPFGSDEQLACFTDATQAGGAEGVERKLQEIRYAVALEQEYSKEDILLGYLNLSNFGGRTYGIEAAAQYYFNTSAADLELDQAATLAGMVQNPNWYRIDRPEGSATLGDGTVVNSEEDGYAQTQERKRYVLTQMLNHDRITQEQYDEAWNAPIDPEITERETGCGAAGGSAYFCKYVEQAILTDPTFGETSEDRWETLRRGGLDVYTTLDFRVQQPAEAAMAANAGNAIEGMNFGAAGVTLEASTGRILALTQNTGFSEDEQAVESDPSLSSLVYAADSAHGQSTGFPVGSTYKLFTLVDWLEQGRSINEVVNGSNRVFQWTCDGNREPNSTRIGNFGNTGGYTGTVTEFTRDSLNSGYLAMAEQLDVCEINRVAERFGVAYGDGTPVTANEPGTAYTQALFDVLGSKNIAPLAMASAYATIANEGVRCEPRAIDRIVDADGDELPVPDSECERVIEPDIAATAADALASVMAGGGTGASANPGDGTPLIGKTGTHENEQTMMIESSTAATTAVWVGQTQGPYQDLSGFFSHGGQANDLRYPIAAAMQGAANANYPGGAFPAPNQALIREVLVDLPDVTGMPVDEAESTLTAAGFRVNVAESVPGDQPEGRIQRQDPGAGQAVGGSEVTIFPSTGEEEDQEDDEDANRDDDREEDEEERPGLQAR